MGEVVGKIATMESPLEFLLVGGKLYLEVDPLVKVLTEVADTAVTDTERRVATSLRDGIRSAARRVQGKVATPVKPTYCTAGCTGPHHRPDCALAGQVRYTS